MVAKREAKASTVPPLSSPLTCPTLSSTLSWRRHSATLNQLGGSNYKGSFRIIKGFKLLRDVMRKVKASN
ncbi:unnamed protein product [Prunus armeniaca]|uniref:Uncharacterized protein n=1 Tax=Prunus armeniaca TaxID=36596 RepID=A0A6J5Y2P5_PRUAR|nr:unnamed protein product [Prunus armeniaca]